MKTETDTRFCYGARCTWFGSIHEVGSLGPMKLPCCPLCSGMLFELPEEAPWWTGVDRFEAEGHPGYRAMWEWQREQNRCFPSNGTLQDLIEAYKKATGITVAI